MFRGEEWERLAIKNPEQQNSTGAGIVSCMEMQAVATPQEALLLVQTLTCLSGLWFLVAFRIKRFGLDISNVFLLDETPPSFMRKDFVLDEHSGTNVLPVYCQHYHLFFVCAALPFAVFPAAHHCYSLCLSVCRMSSKQQTWSTGRGWRPRRATQSWSFALRNGLFSAGSGLQQGTLE